MGQIVKVKVSYYVSVETDEMEDAQAFNAAEEIAETSAQEMGLEEFEIEAMEITGCILPPEHDEDAAYNERRFSVLCSA